MNLGKNPKKNFSDFDETQNLKSVCHKILPEVALHFLEHSVLRTVQIFKNILILTECPLVNVDFLNGGIADGNKQRAVCYANDMLDNANKLM